LFAANLTIGREHALYQDDWLTIIGQNAMDWLDRFLLITVGLVALVLFAAQRRQVEYLWIFAVGVLTLAESPVTLISTFHDIPMKWAAVECICRLFSPYLWALLYFSFVHQRIGWRWRIFLIFAGVANFYSGIATILFPATLSHATHRQSSLRRSSLGHYPHCSGRASAARQPRGRDSADSSDSFQPVYLCAGRTQHHV
jgi:hypothetical protein